MSVFYTLNARATACLTKLSLRGGGYRTPLAPPRPGQHRPSGFSHCPPACPPARLQECGSFRLPLASPAPDSLCTLRYLNCPAVPACCAGEAALPPGGARAAVWPALGQGGGSDSQLS